MSQNRRCFNLSQKHFEYSAQVINKLRTKYPQANAVLDDIVVNELIPIYSKANAKFKPELFKKLCGVANENSNSNS